MPHRPSRTTRGHHVDFSDRLHLVDLGVVDEVVELGVHEVQDLHDLYCGHAARDRGEVVDHAEEHGDVEVRLDVGRRVPVDARPSLLGLGHLRGEHGVQENLVLLTALHEAQLLVDAHLDAEVVRGDAAPEGGERKDGTEGEGREGKGKEDGCWGERAGEGERVCVWAGGGTQSGRG
jgi:hypothetical protein